jgi:hypothetical protein
MEGSARHTEVGRPTPLLHTQVPLLDELLERHRDALGGDFTAYRNHGYRVLNFCAAQVPRETALEKIAIACSFHDLGIWTHGTFDYLAPSRALARGYLISVGRDAWSAEVEEAIELHHKIRRAHGSTPLVEAFRRADWIDVSFGIIRFGLTKGFYGAVKDAFPDAGFHRRLVALSARRLASHPASPLPMLRF